MKYSNVTLMTTADGSYTLMNNDLEETYHSINGAIGESRHVFLNNGFKYLEELYPEKNNISVLEVGFGSGMNFLVTADYCEQEKKNLNYCGIEAYPISAEVLSQIGYGKIIENDIVTSDFKKAYEELLEGKCCDIGTHSHLKLYIQQVKQTLIDYTFDIVCYDAFSPSSQEEMWDTETISLISKLITTGGIFVTYSITGNLKRLLKSLGFRIEKCKGAAGKREMLRAVKL
jgi:tRNA U34 5-methylaminomethyl-2-thiouridine-forming methyltransferase MnmC